MTYGASEQVPEAMSHEVFLLPGVLGTATPEETVKLVQALFLGLGMDDMLERLAATYALAKALASAWHAPLAARMRYAL